MEAKVTESAFGKMPDGTNIEIYTLESGQVKARIMTYGARVVSLEVPDRHGKIADIVLGYDTFDPYIKSPRTYFGAIVGRYANRIAHGAFPLDGRKFTSPRTKAGTACTAEHKGLTAVFGRRISFPRAWSLP